VFDLYIISFNTCNVCVIQCQRVHTHELVSMLNKNKGLKMHAKGIQNSNTKYTVTFGC